jgi:hypothetical protein
MQFHTYHPFILSDFPNVKRKAHRIVGRRGESRLPRLDDYLLRLRRASAPELADRLRRALLACQWRRRLSRGLVPPHPARVEDGVPEALRIPDIVSNLNAGDIEALLGGRVAALNTDLAAIRDFEAGRRDRFFSRVQPAKDGLDIRAVWEPARLQHFTALLAHLHRRPDDPRRDAIRGFVHDGLVRWMRENPFLHGPHFLSPMECGLRIWPSTGLWCTTSPGTWGPP